MIYFSVDLDQAKPPVGISSAMSRGCLCCGKTLASMGGPGYWLCKDCLDKMEIGIVSMALHEYEENHERV